MANWWQGKVTQAFNPPVEPGEDIALAVDTPVTALQGGTVIGASYGPWGGRVDIQVDPNTVQYYQHLDQDQVSVGERVTAGGSVGLSGGQLSGGQHPASPQYSTGPHIEVGETVGGRPVNPSQLIAAGPQTPGAAAGAASGSPGPLQWLLQLLSGPAGTVDAASQLGASAAPAAAQAGGSLVNVSFPDPVASLRDWFSSGVSQAKAEATGTPGFWNDPSVIIPLVIAAVVVLVVLGTGNKETQTQTQIVPVPV